MSDFKDFLRWLKILLEHLKNYERKFGYALIKKMQMGLLPADPNLRVAFARDRMAKIKQNPYVFQQVKKFVFF